MKIAVFFHQSGPNYPIILKGRCSISKVLTDLGQIILQFLNLNQGYFGVDSLTKPPVFGVTNRQFGRDNLPRSMVSVWLKFDGFLL